jgi:Uma2 family endonuclease
VYHPDREYLDGEIVERNMGETEHSGLQGILAAWFAQRRKQLGIYVFPELRVQIRPTRFLIPDLAVTTRPITTRVLREPPFLCIEILSSEDRAARIEPKIDEYLGFGVAHVWLIDPSERKAWSYTPDGRRETTDVLTAMNPEIRLPLAHVFAELDEIVRLSDQ